MAIETGKWGWIHVTTREEISTKTKQREKSGEWQLRREQDDEARGRSLEIDEGQKERDKTFGEVKCEIITWKACKERKSEGDMDQATSSLWRSQASSRPTRCRIEQRPIMTECFEWTELRKRRSPKGKAGRSCARAFEDCEQMRNLRRWRACSGNNEEGVGSWVSSNAREECGNETEKASFSWWKTGRWLVCVRWQLIQEEVGSVSSAHFTHDFCCRNLHQKAQCRDSAADCENTEWTSGASGRWQKQSCKVEVSEGWWRNEKIKARDNLNEGIHQKRWFEVFLEKKSVSMDFPHMYTQFPTCSVEIFVGEFQQMTELIEMQLNQMRERCQLSKECWWPEIHAMEAEQFQLQRSRIKERHARLGRSTARSCRQRAESERCDMYQFGFTWYTD